MKYQFFNVVDGETRSSVNNHQCVDPRTEETLWDAPIATAEDLDEAVAAAQKAAASWGRTTVAERQEVLKKMAEVLQANSEELKEILMRETGKSVRRPTTSRTE